jgi:hypothetical protein
MAGCYRINSSLFKYPTFKYGDSLFSFKGDWLAPYGNGKTRFDKLISVFKIRQNGERF